MAENTQTAEKVVSIKNVHKSFEGTEVLKGITLEVERGEVVAIIGASGGGKSTLLRCMTLLERADDCELTYGNLTVAKQLVASQVSMTPFAIAALLNWAFNFLVEIALGRLEKRMNYYQD